MNENLAGQIARHRAVVGWLEWQLGQTREALARLEQQEAVATARRPEPRVPDWKLEVHRTGYGPRPFRVHAGHCPDGHGKEITRHEALRLLSDGIEACPFCGPDRELRIDGAA
ncbi:DUF6233 domain-containing protein [Streptomyces sp. NPDC127106]|uniref:DUF6233 domain-containing protein n=1 Tax=Streptomyces sp. NPDC127106 TaxID=3345360 RepID=UPI0036284070